MSEYKLPAEIRTEISKRERKKLRSEGKIPAIYYSHNEKSISIAVDQKDFYNATHSGSHIFTLEIGKDTKKCILRDVQHNPITESVIHADFMGIKLEEMIHFEIPIHIEGTAIGVKEFGGVLEQHLWNLEVKCKVSDIPDAITVDVTDLNLGDSIHVGDVQVDGAEILAHPETSIISVVKAARAEIEVPVEEEVLEEEEKEEEGEEETEKKE